MRIFARSTAIVAYTSLFSMAFVAVSGYSNPAGAVSSTSGGGGPTIPLPYISGRLGPVQAPTNAPTGGVVPDDFCLPGKFDDCGDHLRESPEFSAAPNADGPIFVTPGNLAFGPAEHKVWAEFQSRTTELDFGNEQRDQTTFAFGGDKKFGESFILGAMVAKVDLTTNFTSPAIEDRESGTLAGPYVVVRLSDTLALDARFLFGNADHTVTIGATNTGQYQSQNQFGAVRVSGTFDRGNWRLHPSLELAVSSQDSDAYVDSLRGPISASSTSDSFVTGAVLAYYNGLGLGTGNILPYVGAEASMESGRGDLFGVFRTGGALTLGNGGVLNLDYAYGAIGLSGVEDQMISLRFELPL